MKIPNKLKVGGINYKIKKDYRFKETILQGQCDAIQAELRISYVDQGGNRRNFEKIEETFIHEVLHAVDSCYNNNKLDEESTDRLANGMYQVLKDNKLLK